MADQPGVSTPEPVVKAGLLYGSISTVVVAVIGAGVAFGWLSSDQAQALGDINTYVSSNIVPLGTSLVGIVSVVAGLVSHLVTSFVARSQVVPVDSDAYTVTPKVKREGQSA